MSIYTPPAPIEDAAHTLASQFRCEERFIRHALSQAQEFANEYGRAGYSTETMLAIAMIAHRMETDHSRIVRIVVERLVLCYDAVGCVYAEGHEQHRRGHRGGAGRGVAAHRLRPHHLPRRGDHAAPA